MSHKGKVPAEEKLRITEAYLSGKVVCSEAGRIVGVNHKTITRWASRYRVEGAAGFSSKKCNRKYANGTKLSAVLDYLSGKGSMDEICEQYEIRDAIQLRDWLKAYNRHEDFKIQTGGSRMTIGRETTVEERIQIVNACITNGNDYCGIAHRYRVSYQQVYMWTKKYREMGEAGLQDRRGRRAGTLPSRTPEEELRDRLGQLKRKNYDIPTFLKSTLNVPQTFCYWIIVPYKP